MQELENFLLLVPHVPSKEEDDLKEFEYKALRVFEKVPLVQQSVIYTIDGDLERKTVNILHRAWQLPEIQSQVNYENIFSRQSLQKDLGKHRESIKGFLEATSKSINNPIVVISTPSVLSNLFDTLDVGANNINWFIKRPIVVFKKYGDKFQKEFFI